MCRPVERNFRTYGDYACAALGYALVHSALIQGTAVAPLGTTGGAFVGGRCACGGSVDVKSCVDTRGGESDEANTVGRGFCLGGSVFAAVGSCDSGPGPSDCSTFSTQGGERFCESDGGVPVVGSGSSSGVLRGDSCAGRVPAAVGVDESFVSKRTLRNRRKRVLKKNRKERRKGLAAPVGGGGLGLYSECGEELKRKLIVSRANRYVCENELKAKEAKRKIDRMNMYSDARFDERSFENKRLNLEIATRKTIDKVSSSGFAETLVSDSSRTRSTVSPNSSISVAEENAMRKKIFDLESELAVLKLEKKKDGKGGSSPLLDDKCIEEKTKKKEEKKEFVIIGKKKMERKLALHIGGIPSARIMNEDEAKEWIERYKFLIPHIKRGGSDSEIAKRAQVSVDEIHKYEYLNTRWVR